MSVTLINVLPTPPQTPAAEAGPVANAANAANAADGTTAGTEGSEASGFADLLQAQIGPSLAGALPTEAVASLVKAAKEDEAGADAASVLAALGAVLPGIAPEPRTTLTPPAAGENGDALSRLAGEPGANRPLPTAEARATPAANADAASAANAAAAKPASFAVVLQNAAAEEVLPANRSAETVTPNVPVLGPTASPSPRADDELTVAAPLRDARWAGEFGQKIVWMSKHDQQSAQLTLNPPQMGPIDITLKLDNGSATASFASANPEVREAIESALPRLREMLAGAGIELGQASVSAESFRQAAGSAPDGNAARRGDAGILTGEAPVMPSSGMSGLRRGVGLVDLYA